MTNPGTILGRALITGSVAVSGMGLGLLAKAEGEDAVHPITSHRFHGENAGSVIAFDLERNATALSAQPQLVGVARAEEVGSRRVTL
jgi:hypothetical protein